MTNKIYLAFLWFTGFRMKGDPIPEEEKITYLLRRQKRRLGWLWWPWAMGWLGFWVWLTLHILEVGVF